MDTINPTVASTKRSCGVNSTMFSAITPNSMGAFNTVGLASSMLTATSSKLLSSLTIYNYFIIMEDPSSRVLIDMILANFGNGETFTKALDHAASTGWYLCLCLSMSIYAPYVK
jgi:hypothetical protein